MAARSTSQRRCNCLAKSTTYGKRVWRCPARPVRRNVPGQGAIRTPESPSAGRTKAGLHRQQGPHLLVATSRWARVLCFCAQIREPDPALPLSRESSDTTTPMRSRPLSVPCDGAHRAEARSNHNRAAAAVLMVRRSRVRDRARRGRSCRWRRAESRCEWRSRQPNGQHCVGAGRARANRFAVGTKLSANEHEFWTRANDLGLPDPGIRLEEACTSPVAAQRAVAKLSDRRHGRSVSAGCHSAGGSPYRARCSLMSSNSSARVARRRGPPARQGRACRRSGRARRRPFIHSPTSSSDENRDCVGLVTGVRFIATV